MRKVLTVILAFVLAFSLNAQIEHVYDFNSLSTGELNGQDDWTTIPYTTGPGDLIVDFTNSNGLVSADGTNSLWYPYSGAGYGRAATRKATSNFDFDLTVEGVFEVEFDMRRSHWGNLFGVGFDADGDGHIAPGLSSEFEWDGNDYSFNITGWSKGTYLIRVITNSSTETKKLILL